MQSQALGAKKKISKTQCDNNNGALKTVLINRSILEPIGNFIQTTASKASAWNATGEAGKTAADGN